MNTRRLSSFAFASALGTLALALACCTGSTDGGEEDFSGGQFIGGNGASGAIRVNVLDTDMTVGDSTGFGVSVTNSLGNGVGGVAINCDSELGVAILEPTSGVESTNSSGDMSGVIGCEAPGSYQFACRAGNLRQLVDIICRPDDGSFPGFGGGTAGGGLGGGTAVITAADPLFDE